MRQLRGKGALFFSKEHPQITGYLVIDGIEFEITGWHISDVRSEISARERGKVLQLDIFDDVRGDSDGVERGGEGERDRAGDQEGWPEPAPER